MKSPTSFVQNKHYGQSLSSKSTISTKIITPLSADEISLVGGLR